MNAGATIAITCGVLFGTLVVYAVVKAQKRKPLVGTEGLIGKKAIVRTTLDPIGRVLVEGELWTASAEDSRIEVGEEVIVTKAEGLKLWVKRSEGKEKQ
jgi:membrane-bound ClpP family serine protease